MTIIRHFFIVSEVGTNNAYKTTITTNTYRISSLYLPWFAQNNSNIWHTYTQTTFSCIDCPVYKRKIRTVGLRPQDLINYVRLLSLQLSLNFQYKLAPAQLWFAKCYKLLLMLSYKSLVGGKDCRKPLIFCETEILEISNSVKSNVTITKPQWIGPQQPKT